MLLLGKTEGDRMRHRFGAFQIHPHFGHEQLIEDTPEERRVLNRFHVPDSPKPVTPKDDPTTKKDSTLYDYLVGLNLSFVKERVLRDRICKPDEIDMLEQEYKRWMFLAFTYPEEQVALTKQIDLFWHWHLLYTQEYHDLCHFAGIFLHHVPGNSPRAVPIKDKKAYFARTIELYRRNFGEPPKLWHGMVAGNCYSGCCVDKAPKPKRPWF